VSSLPQPDHPILTPDFFARPTLLVARNLLGQRLVRHLDGRRLCGLIVETEAYVGAADTACHASKGRTARTETMFGPPGHAYVYLIYGMYHMLNLVTEAPDFPAAVLIRAVEPLAGVAAGKNTTNGPGKLCRAFGIDRALNGWPVTRGQQLWLEAAPPVPDGAVATGPRVGVHYAAPADRAAPWRFWLRDNPFVSKG